MTQPGRCESLAEANRRLRALLVAADVAVAALTATNAELRAEIARLSVALATYVLPDDGDITWAGCDGTVT